MTEDNKLTPMQNYMAEKISSFVVRSLFGDDYKNHKFTERLEKAFFDCRESIISLLPWVFVIYGLAYIGQTKIVEILFGLYLGFYVLINIFYAVAEAVTVDEEPPKK